MTTAKNNDLMGYDPLAWMEEEQNRQHADGQEHADKETETLSSAANLKDAEKESADQNDVDADTSIELPSAFNIQSAARMHEQLQALLQGQKRVVIDAQHVNSIDTAALQLLVVFRQEALQSNIEMRITAPSEQFVAAARLLDVADLLGVV